MLWFFVIWMTVSNALWCKKYEMNRMSLIVWFYSCFIQQVEMVAFAGQVLRIYTKSQLVEQIWKHAVYSAWCMKYYCFICFMFACTCLCLCLLKAYQIDNQVPTLRLTIFKSNTFTSFRYRLMKKLATTWLIPFNKFNFSMQNIHTNIIMIF